MKGGMLGSKGQSGGLLGMKGGQGSGRTGPNEGKGSGQRDGGTPEDVNFKTMKPPTTALAPGQTIGELPSDEPAPKGEATLPVHPDPGTAIQRMGEKVDSEPLPAEVRQRVRDYMDILRGGRGAAEEGGGK
jgi:hypothetical protein